MAEKTTFTCDVCGVVKKESNHWWQIGFWYEGHRIVKLELVAWDAEKVDPDFTLHLCGQECVIAKVNEFLNSQGLQISGSSSETGTQP